MTFRLTAKVLNQLAYLRSMPFEQADDLPPVVWCWIVLAREIPAHVPIGYANIFC